MSLTGSQVAEIATAVLALWASVAIGVAYVTAMARHSNSVFARHLFAYKNMAIGTRNGLMNQAPEDVLAIVLTAASVGIGTYFALYRLLVTPPGFLLWIAVLIVSPAAALLLGYTNRPFIAAIVAGSLPAAGAGFGQFLRELTLRGVESAVAGAFALGSIVLPVSGMLYIIGVGVRADGTLHDRKQALTARMAAVILLSFALYWAQDARLVSRLSGH